MTKLSKFLYIYRNNHHGRPSLKSFKYAYPSSFYNSYAYRSIIFLLKIIDEHNVGQLFVIPVDEYFLEFSLESLSFKFVLLLDKLFLKFFRRDFILIIYLYSFLLKQLGFTHVIGQLPRPTIVKACNIAGIEVIDLQHGIISKEHPIYCMYATKSIFFDKIIVWSEDIKSLLLSHFPNLFTDIIVFPALTRSDSSINTLYSKNCIVISLQWGQDNFHNLSLAEYFADLKNSSIPIWLLDDIFNYCNARDFQLVIRPHPRQINNPEERAILKPFLDFISSNYSSIKIDVPLSALDAFADNCLLNITPSSSICIEFSMLQVKSLALLPYSSPNNIAYLDALSDSLTDSSLLFTTPSPIKRHQIESVLDKILSDSTLL